MHHWWYVKQALETHSGLKGVWQSPLGTIWELIYPPGFSTCGKQKLFYKNIALKRLFTYRLVQNMSCVQKFYVFRWFARKLMGSLKTPELAARVKDWENKNQIVSYQSYMILQLQRGKRSQLQIKTFLDLKLDLYVLQFKW